MQLFRLIVLQILFRRLSLTTLCPNMGSMCAQGQLRFWWSSVSEFYHFGSNKRRMKWACCYFSADLMTQSLFLTAPFDTVPPPISAPDRFVRLARTKVMNANERKVREFHLCQAITEPKCSLSHRRLQIRRKNVIDRLGSLALAINYWSTSRDKTIKNGSAPSRVTLKGEQSAKQVFAQICTSGFDDSQTITRFVVKSSTERLTSILFFYSP